MSAIALPSSDISIHALRGEGDLVEQLGISGAVTDISIHALRGEGDPAPSLTSTAASTFQSTPSVGRATTPRSVPRSGSRYFNPRPPWGGRPYCRKCGQKLLWISIHALRGEGDACRGERLPMHGDFNPRPPWGGRQRLSSCSSALTSISIHALRGEGDDIEYAIETLHK